MTAKTAVNQTAAPLGVLAHVLSRDDRALLFQLWIARAVLMKVLIQKTPLSSELSFLSLYSSAKSPVLTSCTASAMT